MAGCTTSGGSAGDASSAGSADGGSGERAAPAEPGAQAQGDAAGDGPGSQLAADVPVAERDLVHTADLSVEVENVRGAAEEAVDWTESTGGYVAAENVQTTEGSPPHASLTLHVPQKRYEEALEELAGLGTRSSLDRRVEDVTEQVADVDSRVESAEASLERLRELLDEAESVEDVLAVEEQISTRQQDLEALQARQESLAQQTSYGTVRLDLAPPETYVEEPADDSIGFLGGLLRGWRALVDVAQAASVAVGWLLPFVALGAAVGTPAWLLWRRRRSARGAGAEPVPTAVGAAHRSGPDSGEAEGAGPAGGPDPDAGAGSRADDADGGAPEDGGRGRPGSGPPADGGRGTGSD
ncbi:hypothetical protein GCM10023224_44290 [Streptomonospora halophila]|uniref:DUF4349 domain-containing protein n=1 Tax=Streptomonospora halophila TaxID=427369 RepID=A0ABP9H1W0_9ACTN